MENPYPQVLSAPTLFPASHTNMQDLFYNSTKACAHIRVHVCCERLKLGQVGGGSIISHNMPAFRSAKKQDEEGSERRRQIFSGYSCNVQAAGDGRALAWAFSWNAAFTVPTSSLCFLLTAHHKTYCRTYFFKPFASMTSTQMLGFGHLRFVITLDIYIYNTTIQNLNMLASMWIDIWDSGTCFTLFASNGWCCCPKVLGRIKVRLTTYDDFDLRG